MNTLLLFSLLLTLNSFQFIKSIQKTSPMQVVNSFPVSGDIRKKEMELAGAKEKTWILHLESNTFGEICIRKYVFELENKTFRRYCCNSLEEEFICEQGTWQITKSSPGIYSITFSNGTVKNFHIRHSNKYERGNQVLTLWYRQGLIEKSEKYFYHE